ncbi:MAG: histidine kinase [Acidobacteria bacterium]|nr:histidine kinase [Acidobacteriota bacterium]
MTRPDERTKKAAVALLHLGYWLLYLLLLAVILAIAALQPGRAAGWRALAPLFALSVAPNLVSFYAFYFPLFARLMRPPRPLALAVAGALVCLAAALFAVLLAAVFYGFEQPVFRDARESAALAASFFALAAVHGGIALVLRGFVAWFDETKAREELARRNFETELALVKSQLDPHFLFNTLNNIDVLIGRDPEKASLCLNRLSDILRFLVYETKSERVLLARELEHLEKYVELQRIRTSNAGYVRLETAGAAAGRQIAPAVFFPFVENAFKHSESRTDSISIKIAVENPEIVFECENSYRPKNSPKQEFGGRGNALAARRLELLYPEKHRLEIADTGAVYRVKLTLYED